MITRHAAPAKSTLTTDYTALRADLFIRADNPWICGYNALRMKTSQFFLRGFRRPREIACFALGKLERQVLEETWRLGEVSVRDHGPGIAAEDAPHVFDRFWRASSARHLPGSGLGLSIVKDVAEKHGGTVTLEPAPGGGAHFRLRLVPA